jgi:hypothetical protein
MSDSNSPTVALAFDPQNSLDHQPVAGIAVLSARPAMGGGQSPSVLFSDPDPHNK